MVSIAPLYGDVYQGIDQFDDDDDEEEEGHKSEDDEDKNQEYK